MKAGLNASEKVGKKWFLSERNVEKVSHENFTHETNRNLISKDRST